MTVKLDHQKTISELNNHKPSETEEALLILEEESNTIVPRFNFIIVTDFMVQFSSTKKRRCPTTNRVYICFITCSRKYSNPQDAKDYPTINCKRVLRGIQR